MAVTASTGGWRFWKIGKSKDAQAHANGAKAGNGAAPVNGSKKDGEVVPSETAPKPENQTNGHTNGANGAGPANGTGPVNGSAATKGPNEATGTSPNDHLKDLVVKISNGLEAPKLDDVARLKLTAAAQELFTALRPPTDHIMGLFAHLGIISAVRVFQSWKVFDTIPVDGSISIAELAAQVNAEEVLLSTFTSGGAPQRWKTF